MPNCHGNLDKKLNLMGQFYMKKYMLKVIGFIFKFLYNPTKTAKAKSATSLMCLSPLVVGSPDATMCESFTVST